MKPLAIKIPLDIITANKSKTWVDEFIWPVNSYDLLTVRKDIEMAFYSILRKEDDELLMSILRVTFNRLVVEHVSLINALLVINRFKSMGYGMDASHQRNKYGLFKGLIETEIPKKPIFLPELLQRRSIKSYIKSIINTSKREIFLGLKKKKYRNFSILMVGGIAEEISEILTGTFHWMDRYDIFSQITFSNRKNNSHNIAQLAEEMTQKILQYWSTRQIPVESSMKDYLYSYHSELFYRTSCFLNSSLKTNMLQNRNVWVGPGGGFIYRVIAEIVQKQNGYITCHDHAESKALYNTSIHGYAELGLCNRYVTYTKSCVELYEQGWTNAMSLTNKMPEIDVSPVGCGRFYYSLVKKNLHRNIKINSRKVIYVSGGFDNDLNFYANRPHDMVYFEWQIWMLKAVNEMGYSVGVKYHPETMFIKRNMSLGDNVEYLNGLFQDYLDRDDILIFDTTCSTALQIALCSANPIVFIYSPINEIYESVLKDLAGRVEIVWGFFDNKNRFRVDLDELVSALEQCDKDKDYEFVRKYSVEF
jgi:hypothetical protein